MSDAGYLFLLSYFIFWLGLIAMGFIEELYSGRFIGHLRTRKQHH